MVRPLVCYSKLSQYYLHRAVSISQREVSRETWHGIATVGLVARVRTTCGLSDSSYLISRSVILSLVDIITCTEPCLSAGVRCPVVMGVALPL